MSEEDRPAILVADDEESMRFFLRKTLRRAGYEVVTVPDGRAAVSAIRDRPWVAMLVDLKMPGLDGVGVLEEVRASGLEFPVVLMTGFGSVDNALEAMKRGASDYIRKPFQSEQIVEVVRAAIDDGCRPRSHLIETSVAPWSDGIIGELVAESRARGGNSPPPDRAPTLRESIRTVEWIYIDEALRRHNGIVTAAAKEAGISRPSFHRKMRELGIDAADYR